MGNGLTLNESVSHFSLWCLVKAPLILGNDLRVMTPETLSVLTNDEVIALNQDVLGIQGRLVSTQEGLDVWSLPLSDGSVGVILFHRNDSAGGRTADITARWSDIGLPAGVNATVRDLWQHQEVGHFSGNYTARGLAPRQSVTVRITPVKASDREVVLRNALDARDAASLTRRSTMRLLTPHQR